MGSSEPGLLSAAKEGDVEKVQELLSKGANPNAKNKEGSTALHLVGLSLAAADALLTAASRMGLYQRRDTATQPGDLPVMASLLVEHGADVNAQANDGWTPLHSASSRGFSEVARVLLEHGADVNAQANDGGTPLHLAAHSGQAEVAAVLLDRGADVNARDRKRRTPLKLARIKRRDAVADLLRKHGAE